MHNQTRTLKHGDTFAVFNLWGDVSNYDRSYQGIYHQGTRYLSHLELQVEDKIPQLLNSTITYNNEKLLVDITNQKYKKNQTVIESNSLYISRSKFIWKGVCRELIRITNFGLHAVEFNMSIRFEADFSDIFEVRGARRDSRGRQRPVIKNSDSISFVYEGLDNKTRATNIKLSPEPNHIHDSIAFYNWKLEPGHSENLYIAISCNGLSNNKIDDLMSAHSNAWTETTKDLELYEQSRCHLTTSNEQFNNLLNRSFADLHIMLTPTESGIYPYAGVPWYATVFGRDGIITALQTLWIKPDIAKGVLSKLADTQATEIDSKKDSQPGKILHEMRDGEMAQLGEIPFKEYYGSIDSTPLFIILAGSYFEQTGDIDFIRTIWPNIQNALDWINEYGDIDRDGFVEYMSSSENGLRNQGWKDSHDSIFNEHGKLAEGPIALSEVQGYVYDARIKAGKIAEALGHSTLSKSLMHEAEQLKIKFNNVFWQDESATYALALDGNKSPCRVVSSNPGHCLFTEIADNNKASRLVEALMKEDMFTKWGIRTLSSNEVRYNPMSYHNGSIWPHDNSIIAGGFAKYGYKDYVIDILTAFFRASAFMELHRLPELYCGFNKKIEEGPTLYPVACSPQAWAIGSIFLLLQACLGISIDGVRKELKFSKPVLPSFLDRLKIQNLSVGDGFVDLEIRKYSTDVGINILKKPGSVTILVNK